MESHLAKASGPTEIVFKQPNKVRITENANIRSRYSRVERHDGMGAIEQGVNQVTGENLKAIKATPTTTIASDGLFSPIKIPDLRSRATLIGEIGVARINDRESYQVTIEDSSTQSIHLPIQLFFDVESGLLLRRELM